jgi:hypothetical protein
MDQLNNEEWGTRIGSFINLSIRHGARGEGKQDYLHEADFCSYYLFRF